jgi:hypothetical protein
MITKFKHNDTVVIRNSRDKKGYPLIGEIVDVVFEGVAQNPGQPPRILWKYKVWVRYSNMWYNLDEIQLEEYNDS